MSESIKVLVRVRPLLDNDFEGENAEHEAYLRSQASAASIVSETMMEVESMNSKSKFVCSYDRVFGPETDQQGIYDVVQTCTSSVLDGFNSTVFAYGQTGSGKTFTMYGPPDDMGRRTGFLSSGLAGIIPRAVNDIFQMSEQPHVIQISVYCSFVQVYNEQLFDMLRDVNMTTPLTIREDRDNKEMYVQGLSEYSVRNVNDALQLLRIAEENRTVRETYINQFSSRSHSIFQMYVEQKQVAADGGEVYLRAKYNLVDLAGSEKWDLRQDLSEDHVTEMTNINLSLHTLGRCISSLVDRSQGREAHVPYRDSKLTRLLQDSLGGNARTMLVATVSADRANCEETISTLKFADNAKRVMVQAVVNETRPVDHAMVQRLQDELARLKQLVVSAGLEPGATASAVMDGAGNAAAGAVVRKSLDKNDTGLADSNSQAVANMRAALNEERERGESFKNEINNLRRALHDQKAQFEGVLGDAQAAHLQQQQQQRGASQGAISAQQAKEGGTLLQTILTREVETWKQVDKMKRVLEKFFRFELEEEVLKGKLDKFFAALSKLQDLSLGTIEHVQTGQMGGAPLHALLVASKGSEGVVAAAAAGGGGGNASPAAAAPVSATKKQQPEPQPQTAQQQQEPLFKKSAKAKPLSGAGAAAASSAIHAFGSGGGGGGGSSSSYDNDDNDDADVDENGNATHRVPLSHLSIDTKAAAVANGTGSIAITSIESVKSNGGSHKAAVPPPRQMNMPVTMQQQQQQQEVPQVQDRYEDYGSSSSFLTAVDSGLPHIRSSLDGGLPQQQQGPGGNYNPQQQQRASADSFAGFKKPSPKAAYAGAKAVPARSMAGGSKQLQQQQQPVAMGRERGGQRGPMPPKQQQLMQPRQMNVPITMQQQFQGQQQQQQLQQAGAGSVASRTVNRQASAGSLHQTGQQQQQQQQHGHGGKGMSSRENSRVRLEAAAIIDDTPDEEEEEAQLRKELAKAQKKLKKQQQLQEWIREKENRALAAQASEDQVKQAQEQEELQKERKRKEYAKKQKEKLQGYKHKITQEAQKIQELVDLGIDPNSLF